MNLQAANGKMYSGQTTALTAADPNQINLLRRSTMANSKPTKSNSTNKICSVVGCHRIVNAYSLCRPHRRRMRLYGNPTAGKYVTGTGATPAERFWSKVDKTPGLGNGECWEWRGSVHRGYGATAIKGIGNQGAHRAAWFYTYGTLPVMILLHSCDNPPCVNPAHLREGTHQDNADDKMDRGRHFQKSLTHCKHGHPFDKINTIYLKSGYRLCRQCKSRFNREHRERAEAKREMQKELFRGLPVSTDTRRIVAAAANGRAKRD